MLNYNQEFGTPSVRIPISLLIFILLNSSLAPCSRGEVYCVLRIPSEASPLSPLRHWQFVFNRKLNGG